MHSLWLSSSPCRDVCVCVCVWSADSQEVVISMVFLATYDFMAAAIYKLDTWQIVKV